MSFPTIAFPMGRIGIKNFFKGHSLVDSIFQRGNAQPNLFAPCAHTLSFSLVSQINIGLCVSCLLCAGSPHAISKEISFVVIDSFDSLAGGAFSHVSQEIFKLHPSGGYSEWPVAEITGVV